MKKVLSSNSTSKKSSQNSGSQKVNQKGNQKEANQKEAILDLSAEKLQKQLEIMKVGKQSNIEKQSSSNNVISSSGSNELLNNGSLDQDDQNEGLDKGLFTRFKRSTNLWGDKSKSIIAAKSSCSLAEITTNLSSISDSIEKKPKINKHRKVISEIYQTELSYSNDLESIVNGYMKEMDSEEWRDTPPTLLFGNIDEIFSFSRKLSDDLKLSGEDTAKIAELFTRNKERFIILYGSYCTNYVSAIEKLEDLLRDSNSATFFSSTQTKLQHMLPISSYLLKPVQRILKYQLLLSSLADALEKAEIPYDLVREAANVMGSVADEINKLKHEKEDIARFEVFRSSIKNLENFDFRITGPILMEEISNFNKSTRLILIFKRYILINSDINENIQCTNVLPIRQIDIIFDLKRSKLILKLDNESFVIKGKTEKRTKCMYEKIQKLQQDILEQLKSKNSTSSEEFSLPTLQICERTRLRTSFSESISSFSNMDSLQIEHPTTFDFSSGDSNVKEHSDDSISAKIFNNNIGKSLFYNTLKKVSNPVLKPVFTALRHSISPRDKYGSVIEKNSTGSGSLNFSSLRKKNMKSSRPSLSNHIIYPDFTHSVDFITSDACFSFDNFKISDNVLLDDKSTSMILPSIESLGIDMEYDLHNDATNEKCFESLESSESITNPDNLSTSNISEIILNPSDQLPLLPKKNSFESYLFKREERSIAPPVPQKKVVLRRCYNNRSSMFIPKPPAKKTNRMSALIHGTTLVKSQSGLIFSTNQEQSIGIVENTKKSIRKPIPQIPQKKV